MTSSFARRARPSEHSNRVRSTVVPTCGRVKETARARDRAPLAGPGRFRLEECLRDRYTDRVNARARTWGRGLRGALAAATLIGAVVLPVEITLSTDEAAPAPHPSFPLLLASSCLLLISSGLTLRREEAARRLASLQANVA